MMIVYGAFYSFGVFFKPVLTDFGWTRAATSGAHSLCFLLSGAEGIFLGRLSDRYGPRLTVTICGIIFGLGYLLMAQINALWQLYLFYGVMVAVGVGSYVPLISAVARWFVKRRGLMSGIVVSGVGAGTMVMPPVANLLISNYGWRNSYVIVGIIALVLIVVAAQFLRRDPSQMGQLPYGADEVKSESTAPGAQGFSLNEAIRTRQFWIFTVALFFALFCIQTMLLHIVPHATDIGISTVSAAGILSVIGGLSIVGRIGTGSMSDRIGNRLSLVIVLILISVALFWLTAVREMWMFYLFAIIFGFGYGGVAALESPRVAELFGLSSHGVIFGAVVFGATIGGAIGPLVAGRIFDITGSYQLAFLISGTLGIVSLILALLLRRIRRQGLL